MWQGVHTLINSNRSNTIETENYIRPCFRMKINIIYLKINVILNSLIVAILRGNSQYFLSQCL